MLKKAFGTLSAAEVTSLLLTSELTFVQKCEKWLHYFKIEKLELDPLNYEVALAPFVLRDDLHNKYAVLTGPLLASKLKDQGYTVFESDLFQLRDTIYVITTRNGFSWVAYKWFTVDLSKTATVVPLDINI